MFFRLPAKNPNIQACFTGLHHNIVLKATSHDLPRFIPVSIVSSFALLAVSLMNSCHFFGSHVAHPKRNIKSIPARYLTTQFLTTKNLRFLTTRLPTHTAFTRVPTMLTASPLTPWGGLVSFTFIILRSSLGLNVFIHYTNVSPCVQ